MSNRGQSRTWIAIAAITLGIPLLADHPQPVQGSVTRVSASTRGYDAESRGRANAAPNGPGDDSYFDLARKDCVGTARNSTSKVWFSVADGALSDVYYPTIDNTNVQSLQYIVTDGKSFTDLQARNMTYVVKALDGAVPDCEVMSTATNGRFRIITDFLTNPWRNAVVMRMRFVASKGSIGDYRLYLRFDPTINGNGGGGLTNAGGDSGRTVRYRGHLMALAYDRNTQSAALNRTYAAPTYAAIDASVPFSAIDNGFVGTASDGLVQLDAHHRLTRSYSVADDGNLVQTIGLPLRHSWMELALGFGRRPATAELAAASTVQTPFQRIRSRYRTAWLAYDSRLHRPDPRIPLLSHSAWASLLHEYYLSANVLKTSEDKTFPGAIVASMTTPWGQAVPADTAQNLYYSGYHEVWARDLYEIWTALMLDGDRKTARQALSFLFFHQQQVGGFFPRNSLLNGKLAPDSTGVQLDECSYPIIMANQMGWHTRRFYERHVKPDANFIISVGPSSGTERWEDQSGYSPSTIAAEIAGLDAAAAIATKNHDDAEANIWRATADTWLSSIKHWTVTTNGPLAKFPYFIRLSKFADPNQADIYDLGNGAGFYDQRAVVDQGFLELVRLGELPAMDLTVRQSLRVVDRSIRRVTRRAPGWLRYSHDGYGHSAGTGTPWVSAPVGEGHVWPVLGGERAEYDLAAGERRKAAKLLTELRKFGYGVGLMPEQVWDSPNLAKSPYGTDPTVASIGFRNGSADGSATPLSWAQAQFIRLFLDVDNGSVMERPSDTATRYISRHQRPTRLSVKTPVEQATVDRSKITVEGRGVAQARIFVAVTNIGQVSPTRIFHGRVGGSGAFRVRIDLSSGASNLTVAVIGPHGGTNELQRTVFWEPTAS